MGRGINSHSDLQAAADALGRLGLPAATPILLTMLDDPDSSVRRGAVRSLGKLPSPKVLARLRKALAGDSDSVVRAIVVSSFGKMMDPLADKLLVSSSFIMLTSLGWIPAWVVCVIIGRELAITGLRNILVENGKDISASNLGKYKTGFQIAAAIPLLFHYPYFCVDLHAIGMFFLWGALIFTI